MQRRRRLPICYDVIGGSVILAQFSLCFTLFNVFYVFVDVEEKHFVIARLVNSSAHIAV
jgi:hypothetical protein